jgi:hypothetical protein
MAALLTLTGRRVSFAYAGGGLFVTVCLYTVLVLTQPFSAASGPGHWTAAAFGLIIGPSLLLAAAARLRAPAAGASRRFKGTQETDTVDLQSAERSAAA